MASTKVKPAQIEERLSLPCIHHCGSVDLLPDGSGALLGGWGGVWIVDLPSGKERRRFREYTGHTLWNGRVSRDGKRAVGAFGDMTLHAWDIESTRSQRSCAYSTYRSRSGNNTEGVLGSCIRKKVYPTPAVPSISEGLGPRDGNPDGHTSRSRNGSQIAATSS
jgi:hypothetical protein